VEGLVENRWVFLVACVVLFALIVMQLSRYYAIRWPALPAPRQCRGADPAVSRQWVI